MLWIALYFPDLSLEAVNRASLIAQNTQSDAGVLFNALSLVITDGTESRPLLHSVNTVAREAGLRPGMTLASARAMDSTLTALPRQPEKERACLQRIATWLAQFTPSIAIEPEINHAEICIEIASSLKLFGGVQYIAKKIRRGMKTLGYRALLGVAPNALAAQLLARAAQHTPNLRMCEHPDQLRDRIEPLPVTLFHWSEKTLSALQTLGLFRIRDVLLQPRTGLIRRFGETTVSDLDRTFGTLADPRVFFQLPERFSSSIDFLFEIKSTDLLLHPITQLLIEMEGFLRARGAGAMALHVSLKHNREQTTSLDFKARQSIRDAHQWLRLVRERMNSTVLESPVMAVSLSVVVLHEFTEESADLLPAASQSATKIITLMDRLASRLGEKSVYRIAVRDDHRPEQAWRSHTKNHHKKSASDIDTTMRPTWLLREPRSLTTLGECPQYQGALTLLAGPERIDTGWWDGKPVARDYFVARNPCNEVCWVFRDYRQGKRWYLHGFFS
jgi:protein ImuB